MAERLSLPWLRRRRQLPLGHARPAAVPGVPAPDLGDGRHRPGPHPAALAALVRRRLSGHHPHAGFLGVAAAAPAWARSLRDGLDDAAEASACDGAAPDRCSHVDRLLATRPSLPPATLRMSGPSRWKKRELATGSHAAGSSIIAASRTLDRTLSIALLPNPHITWTLRQSIWPGNPSRRQLRPAPFDTDDLTCQHRSSGTEGQSGACATSTR